MGACSLDKQYKAFSFAFYDKGDKTIHEYGNKSECPLGVNVPVAASITMLLRFTVILPTSALELLEEIQRATRMPAASPYMFAVSDPEGQRKTHCGVLEFSATEGRCYLPNWVRESTLNLKHPRRLPTSIFCSAADHASIEFGGRVHHPGAKRRSTQGVIRETKGQVEVVPGNH